MILKPYLTRDRPVSIVHFITNRCNARCRHCFIDFDDENVFRGDLSLEEIKKFIGNLGTSLKNVNLTGGEPFLRSDFYEILQEYFNRTSINSAFITSNGYFGDKIVKCANEFIEDKNHGKKKIVISISIDNLPEKHDDNRRIKGLFDRAINSYHKLREMNNKKVITNVNLCVTQENCEDIENIFKFLTEEKGVKAITSILVRGKRIEPEARKRIYAGYSKLGNLIDFGLKSGKLEGYGGSFFGKAINAKNVILHREVSKTFLTNEYISPCYAGGLFGVVCANGDVYPCEMLSMKMGNLRDYGYDLNRIFDSRPAELTRRYIRNTNCHCTYECAWSINILMNPKYAFEIAKNTIQPAPAPNQDFGSLDTIKNEKDDVSMYKEAPKEYADLVSPHPVIKTRPVKMP